MDNEVLKIRPARIGDADHISRLSDQLGYATTSEEVAHRIEGILCQDDHSLEVVQGPDQNLVGWVHVFFSPLVVTGLDAEIGGLIVDQEHRGRGIGRGLMKQAEAWAREKGCQAIRLRSNIIRTEAHEFYEQVGYAKVKTQWVFRKDLKV
jgi:GNAT superfamily N-acetyltransferase